MEREAGEPEKRKRPEAEAYASAEDRVDYAILSCVCGHKPHTELCTRPSEAHSA